MMTVLDSAAGITDPGRMDGADTARPDPEVPERARRRTFTAKYKLKMGQASGGPSVTGRFSCRSAIRTTPRTILGCDRKFREDLGMELTPEQAADAVELHPCPNCQSPPDSLAGLDQ